MSFFEFCRLCPLIFKRSGSWRFLSTNQKVVGSNPAGLTNEEALKSASFPYVSTFVAIFHFCRFDQIVQVLDSVTCKNTAKYRA